jgi:tRNA (cytidine/uridine-2'-O-)-methyltransferase
VFHIALYTPQIAPNTGNIIRLAANTGFSLHLIEPLGFDFEDKQLRRAGLDYHEFARVEHHTDYASFLATIGEQRIFACTTHGSVPHSSVDYQPGDVLLFGPETTGLPASIRNDSSISERIRIPMQPGSRSLNLANAVAIIGYEAWRQQGFSGGT